MKKLEKLLKHQWNTDDVKDIAIDEEFGCVTATIDGHKNVDCGWIDELEKSF